MLHLHGKYQLIKLVYSDNTEYTKKLCGNNGFLLSVNVKGAHSYMNIIKYSALLHRTAIRAACNQLEQNHFCPS
jgi:hypothetical protein